MALFLNTTAIELLLYIAMLVWSGQGHILRSKAWQQLRGLALVANEGIPVGDVIKPWGWTYKNPNGNNGLDIVMIHTEKAGGANSISLVKALAAAAPGPAADVHVVHEHSALPTELQGSEHFKIGMIREPCGYYSSEYSWGFHPGGGWLRTHLTRENQTYSDTLYSEDGSPQDFARWLKFVSGFDGRYMGAAPQQRCGLLSTRIYGQALQPTAIKEINDMYKEYLAHPKSQDEYNKANSCEFMDRLNPKGSETGHCPCPLGNCAGNAPPQWHKACARGIMEANLSKIDCWVRTETLNDDLKQCMDKFSTRGGQIGKFDEVVGPAQFSQYDHPESYYKSCSSMFDEELAKFVYEGVDASYVKRFGYTECCKPHPSTTMPEF